MENKFLDWSIVILLSVQIVLLFLFFSTAANADQSLSLCEAALTSCTDSHVKKDQLIQAEKDYSAAVEKQRDRAVSNNSGSFENRLTWAVIGLAVGAFITREVH